MPINQYLKIEEPDSKSSYFEVEFLKKKAKYMDMADMRMSRMTLDEISKNFGLTRERIRQILKQYFSDVEFPKPPSKKTAQTVSFSCLHCGKVSEFRKKEYDSFSATGPRRLGYCNQDCLFSARGQKRHKDMDIQEKRSYQNERMKRYYRKFLKGNPEFIAKIKERNAKYLLKLKQRKNGKRTL